MSRIPELSTKPFQKVSCQELKTFVSSVLDLGAYFIVTESRPLFRLRLPEEVCPLKATHTSLADAYVLKEEPYYFIFVKRGDFVAQSEDDCGRTSNND